MTEFPVMAEISCSAETRLKTKRKTPKSDSSQSPSLFQSICSIPAAPCSTLVMRSWCYVEVPVHLRGMSRWVSLLAKGTPQSYSRILLSTNISLPLFFLSQNTKFWD